MARSGVAADGDASQIVLTGLAYLVPMFVAVCAAAYWFAITYATKGHVAAEIKRVQEQVTAAALRIDDIEGALGDGRVTFAEVQLELSYVKTNLQGLNQRLDMLFAGKVMEPQCQVATDAPGAKVRHSRKKDEDR